MSTARPQGTRRSGRSLARAGYEAASRAQDPGRADLEHPRGDSGQAAVHGRGPRGPRVRRQRCPGCFPSCAGPTPPCTPTARGPCASTPGFSTAEASNAFFHDNSEGRPEGSLGRVRPGDPPRLRLGSPARRGRRRQGRRRDRLGRGHEDPVRRDPARRDVGLDDHERSRAPHARQASSWRRKSRASRPSSSPARSRTTSSRSSWSATPTSIRPTPSMRIVADIIEYSPRSTCRASTRSRSAATTCRRPVRRRSRSSRSRLPTGSTTCAPRSAPGSASTSSRPGSVFFWAVGMNFFMEIAKMRAGRLLWAKLIRERQFAPKDPRSLMLRTHSQTSGGASPSRTPTTTWSAPRSRRWPAVLGGTQSLHTNGFDEAVTLPTPFSARIARNTQLILQEETGHHARPTRWPARYYVESLTNAIAHEAMKLIHGGRGIRRHDQGDRSRHAEAADRRSGDPPTGPHRPRRGRRRRRQQIQRSRRTARSRSSTSTTRRCARSRSNA